MTLYDFNKKGKYWALSLTHSGDPLNYNDVPEFTSKQLNDCNKIVKMPIKKKEKWAIKLPELKEWTSSTERFVLPISMVTKSQVSWLEHCLNGTIDDFSE